jgi:hypothetical protein
VQEAERRRVALELHDNITQLLCAVLFRSQALVTSLSSGDGRAKNFASMALGRVTTWRGLPAWAIAHSALLALGTAKPSKVR